MFPQTYFSVDGALFAFRSQIWPHLLSINEIGSISVPYMLKVNIDWESDLTYRLSLLCRHRHVYFWVNGHCFHAWSSSKRTHRHLIKPTFYIYLFPVHYRLDASLEYFHQNCITSIIVPLRSMLTFPIDVSTDFLYRLLVVDKSSRLLS